MAFVRICCAILLFGVVGAACGVEAWTDERLPVKDSLVLWLDATRESAAREKLKLPPISAASPLDAWHDGSGFGFHVVQPLAAHRPRFVRSGNAAIVQFDGENDFLFAPNVGRSLSNLTVFVFGSARSNPGTFRAFLSANRFGNNDFQSGFNLDLGSDKSSEWNFLNAEGAGFEGQRNLLKSPLKFGSFHALTLTCAGDKTQLFVDGAPQDSRSRKAGKIGMDEIVMGARHYSHEAEPVFVDNFIEADVAEVLVFDCVLADSDRTAVENYLKAKHAGINRGQLAGQVPFKMVSNAPPVQMLVPGFSVRELPVQLNNLNNLRYRRDGKLFAVGYDGAVWLLSDTDGDGLEDKAEPYWPEGSLKVPLGIALTPPNYPRGQGIFLPVLGKVVLLLDTNGDDRADQEITVATGWGEAFHNVDALGITLDKENNVYFGLGIGLAFANAYGLDKEGKGHYDLNSPRGTIYKVSADFSHKEKLVTGIRFPVALAFNHLGDLFCTEQEGATWLANGNPFDELLYIEPGRHYGFPPRHPRHLPNVIDEPSVFDYAPQHQSTCGMAFEEPVNGGPIFGPQWWRHDAIITGESRGKLWRTKLFKTAAGYVAENNLIACLSALTIDATISPQGDLVVCTHGGKPDWGTGPKGKGRVFKISYTDTNAAQPLLTWNASPDEFRVMFDRPIDPLQFRELAKKTSITRGKYVAAGDRFETMRPGYQVVQNQMATPRYEVPVLSAGVTPDNRTLVLRTHAQSIAANYALALPDAMHRTASSSELPQHAALDLLANLNGVQTIWKDSSGSEAWRGWLPHLDFGAAREFTSGSKDHEALWTALKKTGLLVLRSQLNLWQMLQPAVQPGSKLDYTPDPEQVTLTFHAANSFTLRAASDSLKGRAAKNGGFEAAKTFVSKEQEWIPLDWEITTGGADPAPTVVWHTSLDPRPRALQLRRFFLPWAKPDTDEPIEERRVIPELAGGDWKRGQGVFRSDRAACFKCHEVAGEGGKIGPDLSNLIHRDYASVIRDILEPSAAINPDHIAYQIEFKDGDFRSGIVLKESTSDILLGEANGVATSYPRSRIKDMKLSAVSLMPEGLLNGLPPQEQKDLLTFLLTESPEKARLSGN